jgi:hypothetical protein
VPTPPGTPSDEFLLIRPSEKKVKVVLIDIDAYSKAAIDGILPAQLNTLHKTVIKFAKALRVQTEGV